MIDREDHGQTLNDNIATSKLIFKISDKTGVIGFIDAATGGVFKNNLDYDVNILVEYIWSKDNELIFWSADALNNE